MTKSSPRSSPPATPAAVPPSRAIPSVRPGKSGGARDRNRRARTAALVEAGLDVFLEMGLAGARIEDITGRAGMSKGAFYRYFRSKEALVLHLLAPTVARMLPAFRRAASALATARRQADLVVAYAPIAQAVMAEAGRSPKTLQLYLAERRAPAVGARRPVVELSRWVYAGASHLTAVSKQAGWLDDAAFVGQLSTVAVTGAVEELLHRGLQGEIDVPPADVVRQLAGMVYGGILRGRPDAPNPPAG